MDHFLTRPKADFHLRAHLQNQFFAEGASRTFPYTYGGPSIERSLFVGARPTPPQTRPPNFPTKTTRHHCVAYYDGSLGTSSTQTLRYRRRPKDRTTGVRRLTPPQAHPRFGETSFLMLFGGGGGIVGIGDEWQIHLLSPMLISPPRSHCLWPELCVGGTFLFASASHDV